MKALGLLLLGIAALAGQGRDAPRGTAGQFDYYLLSLSWSPQYCSSPAGERDRTQCGDTRQYEFILHGLWPQHERGWPQFCSTSQTLSNSVLERMLDIMPSRRLVRHEWDKHGVCSGLTATEYFAKARTAFRNLIIPATMRSPRTARTISPSKIREEFLQANPAMPRDSVVTGCAGRFLSEVRVCLTSELQPRACSQDVVRQGCRVAEIIVQPVR